MDQFLLKFLYISLNINHKSNINEKIKQLQL